MQLYDDPNIWVGTEAQLGPRLVHLPPLQPLTRWQRWRMHLRGLWWRVRHLTQRFLHEVSR